MKILVCIDDTDNLDSKGTGEIAAEIAEHMTERGLGSCSRVTRHQLLVHPDIPYTSHNSAMCFSATIQASDFDAVVTFATDYLQMNSALGSDPGICIAAVDPTQDKEALVAFGRRAKREVLVKSDAYALAKSLKVHLSEHGGTGGGVIGALAGVGLRLSGNDGRLKGKVRLPEGVERMTAEALLKVTGMHVVKTTTGKTLESAALIRVGETIKGVYQDHQETILVRELQAEGSMEIEYVACTNQQLKIY